MKHKFFITLAMITTIIAPKIALANASVDNSTLSLTSQATISRPADELQLSIGVVTLEDTA